MVSNERPAREIAGQSEHGIPLARASGLVMITNTPKGRGVFASQDIPGNTILEVCPVLVLEPTENELHIKNTVLYHYTYNWLYQNSCDEKPVATQAVILGLGSLFNHSKYQQNVGWIRDLENQLVTYKTIRDIKMGEELCISYGDRLTFLDTDANTVQDRVEEREEDVLRKIELF